MLTTLFGKYKAIVVSIALFLLLDASVLMLNFYISFQISGDAVGVNLAGRQRMLSQRMVKSLLDIRYLNDLGQSAEQSRQELEKTYGLFDATLLAFEQGGQASGANGESVNLSAVESPAGKKAIAQARTLWSPFSQQVRSVIDSENREQLSLNLSTALAMARDMNLTLLGLMNDLTVDLEQVATAKAMRLRLIQTVGISLAIVNFLLILFHFLKQLRRNDEALEEARRETEEILSTVNEGLFLLDKDMRVGKQHSARLESMFDGRKVADLTFSELLSGLVFEKDMKTAERFVGLLFRADIKANLITELNPLNEIEINICDENGSYSSRYLSFDFRRVTQKGEIIAVLSTVNDVTDRVKLERELQREKEKGDHQMSLLSKILHVEQDTLQSYLNKSWATLDDVNQLLREQRKGSSIELAKIDDILALIHKFKGDSSALEFEHLANSAHSMEDTLTEVKARPERSGKDLFGVVVLLESLYKNLESVKALAERLAQPAAQDKGKTAKASSWAHLNRLVETLSEREGKKACLTVSGLNEVPWTPAMRETLDSMLVQFLRNSMVHGIELPDERQRKGKRPVARLDIRACEVDGAIEIVFRDDGNGLNVERLRKQCIARGVASQSEVMGWSDKKLYSMIFRADISTASAVTKDAGRGVGMHSVAKDIADLGGSVKVNSKPQSGCLFKICLPLQAQQSEAA
ncbi:type IV pili methyl-accepting chemotaxis transducer N-terminal domain-containing protein [Gilvimarinus sp. SDUM040013]|uniref:histidine kinase n=1 Tax=Gilvimarinus gilvus TaxID=3058038 RepID=A0ABU4RY71_9GAMM|nr:type IV pili methyl-accepting chemotaxis transducer N-terminal domain-containing protein [Gilvimarinus sp. SDUM040013]MDO3385203.1 type IV pili methyl-accepting chemotaxis transducer N-terminal domain-containing protein [Gilvimarinus sp. SDUM040013]MDX6849186.1 type IV pili methyl-accepting chemotaxis transducer N-terminal domain-containing protein [Gilvimarinus sp. SDUM040013]